MAELMGLSDVFTVAGIQGHVNPGADEHLRDGGALVQCVAEPAAAAPPAGAAQRLFVPAVTA